MNATPTTGCSLSVGGLAAQHERVRALRSSVVAVERRPDGLSIRFDGSADATTLAKLIETERECCSFVRIAYDEPARSLDLSVGDKDRTEVLDLYEVAVTVSPGTARP